MTKPLARVLVVEDNPELGALLRALFVRYQIDGVILTSCEQAIECLARETFDLILLDIALPGMNGLEFCHQLKASPQFRHIPVIIVSGQTGEPYKLEAKRIGAVDYIEKPFDMLPFLRCIMGHLNLPPLPEDDIRVLERKPEP